MIKRRKYFISPSIQVKYIVMSVLPALVIGIYTTFFLFDASRLLLLREEGRLSSEISTHICNLSIKTQHLPTVEDKREAVRFLDDLFSIQSGSERRYRDNLKYLEEIKTSLVWGEVLIFLSLGILALIYSHRIAGPIFRIKRYIEMLSEGKEIPPVRVRYYDEFKDVAALLEKLRKKLEQKK